MGEEDFSNPAQSHLMLVVIKCLYGVLSRTRQGSKYLKYISRSTQLFCEVGTTNLGSALTYQ